MSTSSNDSFVVISSEPQDEDGNQRTNIWKPSVTFEDVLDSYPLELNLLVRVAFDETHKEAPEDKILLVPVAWQNMKDAVSIGEKCNNIVKFPLTELPQSGEMCQFCCYNEKDKCVWGLSTPFKLEHYSKDRLKEFIDLRDKATPLDKLETDMARLKAKLFDETTDSQGVAGSSDSESLLVQRTTEVIKNETEKWISEKESLQNEIRELKESVAELKKQVEDSSDSDSLSSTCDKPVIYGITATYTRPEQLPLLMRLSHTLRLIPCFHWIVVEDKEFQSPAIYDTLMESGLSFTHLFAQSPNSERKNPDHREFVVQRNAALRWLRINKKDETGIVYFMDKFKVYSLEIFDEMRSIQKVGVWPVGLAGGLPAEKPLVDRTSSRVVGWNSQWRLDRQFPIDAIGCAINLRWLMANPRAMFSLEVEPALRLSAFLSKLVPSMDELEPKAVNCTKVLVWYIQIVASNNK